ncbi:hypothetical protein [Sinorhizobium medicae]|uniref:hypothetical protein n=1 Tax=Sinorhizobium medicae TaxID=110321 RepID=UPI000FD759C1|nr:hypothetical protein [Sinorhizobium medicae]MDX1003193.1 hypothetical protein [Sinorhizobium medicae]RVO82351.1 hypothetical protein CN084_03250 [Sinorhizobium medicae]
MSFASLRHSQSPENAREFIPDKVDKICGLEFAVSSQAKYDDECRSRVLGQAIDGGQAEADTISGAAERRLQLNPGGIGGALIERDRLAGRRHRELYNEIPAHDVDGAFVAIEARALAEHFELPLADAANAIGI